MHSPQISIVVPIHEAMVNGDYFLWRLVQSVVQQTYKNWELVITQEGSMPVNTNAGIRKAKGDLIKILYLDDYLAHANSLQMIVDAFKPEDMWLATGCLHQSSESRDFYEDAHSPHYPIYTDDIYTGNNRIGSPSVITIRNKDILQFDENLSFLLDCDLYKRYYDTYGEPRILNDLNVVIGIGEHQTSHTMPNEAKLKEFEYVMNKYA
jgi:hypothetical protein